MSVNGKATTSKRQHDEDTSDSLVAKRARVEQVNYEKTSFTSLSDPVLLFIMKYLNSNDIVSTGDTCTRLQRVCGDKTLWKKADFRGKPQSLKNLKLCIKRLHSGTEFLAVEGTLHQSMKKETLSEAILKDLTNKCPN